MLKFQYILIVSLIFLTSLISIGIKGQNPELIITASKDTICNGESVQLNVSGGNNYLWNPATGLNRTDTSNPIATPSKTTTYYVTSLTQIHGANLVNNGDFELGNTGFYSAYGYNSNLIPNDLYYVGINPQTYHPGFYACHDHTSGNGKMMIVNGGTSNTEILWRETINVKPNTDYLLSYWLENISSITTVLAELQFMINGNLIGSVYTCPSNQCIWGQFSEQWNSGNITSAVISIVDQNTQPGGNDFGLDDINIAELVSMKDSLTIVVKDKPVINILYNNQLICKGDSKSLFAKSDMPNTTYQWSTGETSDSIKVKPSNTAIYSLTGTAPNSCIDTASVTVNVSKFTNPAITILPNQAQICYGDSVMLTANGGSAYLWSPSVGLSSTIDNTVYANPVTTTTYTVTGTLNGCSDKANIIVSVNPLPVPSISYTGTNPFCYGGSIDLFTSLPYYSYQWLQGGANINGKTNNSYTATSGGKYEVIVSDNNGCKNSDSINVSQYPIISINLGKDTTICPGAEVILNPHNDTVSYSWSDNSNNSNLLVNKPGKYSITVTDKHGCQNSDLINVSQYPVPYLSLGKDTDICNGCNLMLNAGNSFKSYEWQDGSITPAYDVIVSGKYWVKVSDQYGCKYSDTIIVKETCDGEMFIPNSFSPNGDNTNDIFKVVASPCIKNFEMDIYDRWGNLLYETNDFNNGWDGKYRNSYVSEGVYVYIIIYYNVENASLKLHKRGKIIVL